MKLDKEAFMTVTTAEECLEIGHRIIKAVRFSMQGVEPGQPFTNNTRIQHELCDLSAMLHLLDEMKVFTLPPATEIDQLIEAKRLKVEASWQEALRMGTGIPESEKE